MKALLFAAVSLCLSCGGSALAGEWTHWEGVKGELHAERSAVVTARSRRDEAGDEMEKGYLFVYELRNHSSTLTAKVSLYFPQQDPATRTWSNIDLSHPPMVHDVPPAGTVTGTRYSPSSRGLIYESDIKWSENLTSLTDEKKVHAEADKNAEVKTKTATAATDFEGIALTDNQGLRARVSQSPETEKFRAKMVLRGFPGTRDFPVLRKGTLFYDEIPSTWRQLMDEEIANGLAAEEPYHTVIKVLAASETEMTVDVITTCRNYLVTWLEEDEFPLTMLELERLGPAPANESLPPEQNGEKIISASQAEPKPAAESNASSLSGALVLHQGYWSDPGDKDAKAQDPVIYVRVSGQAKRVKLSAAKESYGVPASAAPDMMSHYSEREGKVLIDRKTHLAR